MKNNQNDNNPVKTVTSEFSKPPRIPPKKINSSKRNQKIITKTNVSKINNNTCTIKSW